MEARSEPFWAKVRYAPIHPWLFAVAPVLYLWARNVDAVTRSLDALTALVAVLALATLLWGVSWAVYRHAARAAVAASFGVLVLLLFGHAGELAAQAPELSSLLYDARYVLGLTLVIGAAAFVWWLRRLEVSAEATQVINVVAAGFVAIQLVALALAGPASLPEALEPIPIAPADGGSPNVHIIVLDGFAGMQTLEDRYALDAERLLEPFVDMGFAVYSHSYSNYGDTVAAIPTVLNLEYWSELPGAPEEKLEGARALASDSLMAQSMQDAGFRHVHVQTSWPLSESSHTADENVDCQGMAPFHRLVVATTPVVLIGEFMDDIVRWQIQCSFDHVAGLSEQERPAFTFTHINPPHPPYVYDRNGNETAHQSSRFDDEGGWNDDEAYTEMLLFTVDALESSLAQALEGAAPDDVFVVLADHGPKVAPPSDTDPDQDPDGLDTDARHLMHKHNVLTMVLGPGFEPGFDDTPFTTVNVGRMVLDEALETELGLLPDMLCPGQVPDLSDCQEIPAELQ